MRNTRAKEIAATGDRELADDVRRLPKPTVAAWLANVLVRTHAGTVEQLIFLGSEHRDAQGRGGRDDMRRVAERRRALVRELVGVAARSAVDAGHSMGSQVQRQLEETLEAAVADDESAAMLRTGRLSSPMMFIGFGGADQTGPRSAQPPVPKRTSSRHESTDKERQAADKALAAATRSLSDAKGALEAANRSVKEARGRHSQASVRQPRRERGSSGTPTVSWRRQTRSWRRSSALVQTRSNGSRKPWMNTRTDNSTSARPPRRGPSGGVESGRWKHPVANTSSGRSMSLCPMKTIGPRGDTRSLPPRAGCRSFGPGARVMCWWPSLSQEGSGPSTCRRPRWSPMTRPFWPPSTTSPSTRTAEPGRTAFRIRCIASARARAERGSATPSPDQ